jgi:hypothetical protein
MKKAIISIIFLASLTTIVSCKKKQADTVTPTSTDQTKATDAAASNELDKVYTDIETVFNSQQYQDTTVNANARTSAAILPCGIVSLNKRNFTITYGGVNCGSRVLSGSIAVSLIKGNLFSDQGAELKITYNNYKVLYYANNQSITYNGTAFVTNTTGGALITLFTGALNTNMIHRIRGNMTLTYDSTGTGSANVTRVWNIYRLKTFTNTSGSATGITVTVAGDTTSQTTLGNYSNVCETGISRDGYPFVCNMPTDFSWSNCGSDYAGPYKLKHGQLDYIMDLSTSNIALYANKGKWSAIAGYVYVSPTQFNFDGTCSVGGYKICDTLFKNNVPVLNFSSFQAY